MEQRVTEQEPIMRRRRVIAQLFPRVLLFAALFAVLILFLLLYSVINNTFGYIVLKYETQERELDLLPLGTGNTRSSLINGLREQLSRNMLRKLETDVQLEKLSVDELEKILLQYVLRPTVLQSYTLTASIFSRRAIQQAMPSDSFLQFRSWFSMDLLSKKQNSNVLETGIRAALFGTLWIMLVTIILTLPIGVATAVYLEEYAGQGRLNHLIQINIYNLSGVPSIVYGLLGLAVFVRMLHPLSSGAMFGFENDNSRTILAASLTLALLVIPIVIINTKEAIAAVPKSLKDASYALGATKWQTIWHHTLPYCMDRILTGTILAISRAVGETAPLVVIGASTFLTIDPSGLFSKFTALPIQIYQWAARPQAEFKHIAAATIVVLLILMLGMNLGAILMRNSIQKRKRL